MNAEQEVVVLEWEYSGHGALVRKMRRVKGREESQTELWLLESCKKGMDWEVRMGSKS